MSKHTDGPRHVAFKPLSFDGGLTFDDLSSRLSKRMGEALTHAPQGDVIAWGIPFTVNNAVLLNDEPVTIKLPATQSKWLIFMHTGDYLPLELDKNGIISPMRGGGQLNTLAARYVICYEDGSEVTAEIRRRHHIGTYSRRWGENCFLAVSDHKPQAMRAHHEQTHSYWGNSQTRANAADSRPWTNWLYAWENPHPEKAITGIRLEPETGLVVLSGITAGKVEQHPLRWQSRRKALWTLPEGTDFDPTLDADGNLTQIQLDMGTIISAQSMLVYPNENWSNTFNNELPQKSECQVVLEYTAHPEATFHIDSGEQECTVPVAELTVLDNAPINPVTPSKQRVTLRVIDAQTHKPVAVKLHLHGEAGEYLAPVDRHRIINAAWFEDYSVDFAHQNLHQCTYINDETTVDLPQGKVYIEISKGFEIKPVRKVLDISAETTEVTIEVEHILPWRERGWVSADTHVHFLSPMSALLEGAAEGVNIVNLLASQWGELMTNVGDFDGKNTWGSLETGGDGEYLVRVGTENRQHVLGHISLLGYRGNIIAPMTTGGPDESALGDPIEILLTEWARQCHKQGGLVVLPHFPNPRAEHAASIISGDIDAVEMTSWGNLYGGIDPYSLSDWYRYLNCGYLVAAVGGTDKMSANTAVGCVRTYAHIPPEQGFTYEAWMDAVKRAETFVTYGPLLELSVDGQPMGSRIAMTHNGGTVDVVWNASSVTVPMTRVDLVINGEIRESTTVDVDNASGHWSVPITKSSWIAILIRGQYPGQDEMIAAHSSPIFVEVEGSQMMAAMDALTILEQIEGALAYLDTLGTRAEQQAYKRMQMVLTSAHRTLHNQMHQKGTYHDHTVTTDHAEHH